jgi:hypothetical protein
VRQAVIPREYRTEEGVASGLSIVDAHDALDATNKLFARTFVICPKFWVNFRHLAKIKTKNLFVALVASRASTKGKPPRVPNPREGGIAIPLRVSDREGVEESMLYCNV